MKKLLLSCALGLSALAFSAAPAQAWTFGLIVHHGCCHPCGHCCSSYFCVKQYNAFSPVACGTMYFDGCSPFGPAGGGCGGDCCPGVNFGGEPCCDGASLAPVPTAPQVAARPPAPYPGPAAPAGFQPAYGYAPMMPPSVTPNGGQNWYAAQQAAAYGR
jgi:hypothetical protein